MGPGQDVHLEVGHIGRKGTSLVLRAATIVASLLAMTAVVATTSRAAFSDTESNGGQTMKAGTVVLSDDDADSKMFNIDPMKPGTVTKCINVTYSGNLAADVKLYAAVGGDGLAGYLTTVIDVGTGATGGASLDCTNYVQGSNLYNGLLSGLSATNYGNGLGGFTVATNPTASVTKSYRISQTLASDNAAQGKSATLTFTWEAQNN
jgi:hypothetical protein